jgi:FG-GAP-like repeat
MINTSAVVFGRLLFSFFLFQAIPLRGQANLSRIPLIQNPLVPTSATAGGAQFTLTVNGTGFVSGAVANWNGHPRTTAFVSSSQLTVTIPAPDIAAAGTAVVTVANPGGSTSPPALFDITNPVSTVGLTRVLDNLGPCSNLTGDFNGDGKPDLVSCNGSQIVVLLGNGDGTFHALSAISNPQGILPLFFITADLNNDSKTDLVGFASVNPLDNQLVTLLGNGDGTFQSPVLSPGAIEHQRFPSSIAVGDFNADGRIDLAVTFSTSGIGGGPGDVEDFLGNGDGTVQTPIVYALSNLGSSHPNGLAVADFNGDGKLDLVVSDSGTGTVFILLGNGDGSFHMPTTVAVGGGQIVTADLNGDSKADLIVTGSASVSVFLGNGDGTFGSAMNFPTPSTTTAAQPMLADLNGDEKLDFVVSMDLGISMLLGNGDGTFQPHSDFPLSVGTPKLGVADFNQDGKLDLSISEGILLQTTAQPVPFGINFGNEHVGSTSAPQPASLTNLGTTTLTIGSVSLAGANPGDFQIASDSCGTSLASATKCTVAITFSPTAKGLRTTSLLFTDNATASPQTIALTGNGLGTAPPRSIRFTV